MSNHVNIENDEITIPYYAVHKDGLIAGFFGPFRFLSNFYILQNGVCFEEMYYPSVEHAYQAAKWPKNERSKFIGITSGKCKKFGKLAPNFDAKKWKKVKYDLMYDLVRQKFTNNSNLREMLWMTNGYQLEERNSWGDTDWGTDVNGKGENRLGLILMVVREHLKIKPEDQF
jgi:ribA/ribD-fused uncharacterized protein